jgi:PTS system nitrogen regulatory IIA component
MHMTTLIGLARLFKPGIVRNETRGAGVQSAIGTASAVSAAHYPRPAGAVRPGQVRDLDIGAEIPAAWLRPQEIVLDADARSAAAVLETAAACLARAHALDAAPILRALYRREQVGSTGLGMGIAIPHARIEGIARPLTLFLRTRDPIEFGAPDGKPVSRFLVIMVPADGATDVHLQLLALLAQAFSDRGFREHLSAATTAAQVDDVFAQWAKCAA